MKVIRSGWEPFEVMLMAGLALSGFGGLLVFDRLEGSTITKFPEPWGQLLFALLGASSLITLVGAAWRTLQGIKVERAGLFGIVCLGSVYGAWAFGVNGLAAFGFAVILFCIVGASLWRMLRIRHDLRAGES